jgi:hypothetical protein
MDNKRRSGFNVPSIQKLSKPMDGRVNKGILPVKRLAEGGPSSYNFSGLSGAFDNENMSPEDLQNFSNMRFQNQDMTGVMNSALAENNISSKFDAFKKQNPVNQKSSEIQNQKLNVPMAENRSFSDFMKGVKPTVSGGAIQRKSGGRIQKKATGGEIRNGIQNWDIDAMRARLSGQKVGPTSVSNEYKAAQTAQDQAYKNASREELALGRQRDKAGMDNIHEQFENTGANQYFRGQQRAIEEAQKQEALRVRQEAIRAAEEKKRFEEQEKLNREQSMRDAVARKRQSQIDELIAQGGVLQKDGSVHFKSKKTAFDEIDKVIPLTKVFSGLNKISGGIIPDMGEAAKRGINAASKGDFGGMASSLVEAATVPIQMRGNLAQMRAGAGLPNQQPQQQQPQQQQPPQIDQYGSEYGPEYGYGYKKGGSVKKRSCGHKNQDMAFSVASSASSAGRPKFQRRMTAVIIKKV